MFGLLDTNEKDLFTVQYWSVIYSQYLKFQMSLSLCNVSIGENSDCVSLWKANKSFIRFFSSSLMIYLSTFCWKAKNYFQNCLDVTN